MHRSRTRLLACAALVAAAIGLAAAPAGACGGLVGENGTIELVRTTTLAAYHDGVERYVTSFEFSGEGESVGSIVPLPAEPTDVVRGGDWTLQRLAQEVAPPAAGDADFATAAESADDGAEIVFETQVDALDITVLKGGGDEVGEWALENGFFLTPDAPEVLDFYGERSPYFMAAKFDASRAAELGQVEGDGTPIMVTIPTDDPWVPLHILQLGLDDSQVVEADVFLLTDDEPQLLAGGPGLTIERNEPASDLLLDDLRSDVGMEWVPSDMWLSYLKVDAPAADLDYDLAISASEQGLPSLSDAGIEAPEARLLDVDAGPARWPLALGLGAGLIAAAVLVASTKRRDDAPTTGMAA
jgi:hypothetical protein